MGTDRDDSSRPWEEREKSAIEKLRALLQENPKDHHIHYELGRILLRRWGSKEHEWGIKHLEEAVRLKKGFPEAIELLAVEAAATDQNKAIRLYKKAASIYAAQDNRKKVDVLLNEAATLVVYGGWDLLNGGDYPAAKKKALRALKIYSPCVDARNILGCIHIYRFEFDEAERVFEKAMKYAIAEQDGKVKIKGVTYWGSLDTRPYMRARHGLGLCYMHRGNFQDALTEFDTLLNLNPNDNQGIRFLLADVYHYMGDEKSAEKYYKKYGEPEGAIE